MNPYVSLGEFTVEAFGVPVRNNVVLNLRSVDEFGIISYEEITILYDNQLAEENDQTNTIMFGSLFSQLIYAINELRSENTNNIVIAERLQNMINVALAYYDNLVAKEASGNKRGILSNIEFLRNATSIFEEDKLPKIMSLYHDLREQEATRRYKNAKAKVIQDAWREAYYNPSHRVCQTRLRNEFNQMMHELTA